MASNYLVLARRAREENNREDAKKYYDMVRNEDPDNVEAKFYYSYYRMMSCTQGQAAGEYTTFCNSIPSTISMLLKSDMSEDEKKTFLTNIRDCIESAYIAAKTAIENIGGSGNAYKDYKPTAEHLLSEVAKAYPKDKFSFILQYDYLEVGKGRLMARDLCARRFKLGDDIEALFASDDQMMKRALRCWKAAVADGREWPGVVEDKTLLVKYADKIKKYEPSYVMPEEKKHGCITIGK